MSSGCSGDAVTALSGSGPAYVFEFAAALRNAGIQCGLSQQRDRVIVIAQDLQKLILDLCEYDLKFG